MGSGGMGSGRIEKLDYAERWLRDGLRAVDPPGGLVTVEVDMSNAVALKRKMQESGVAVTFTHLIVHATAMALMDLPKLHRLVAGNRRLFPDSIDICLSVAGDAVVTPVLLIKNAESKSLVEISAQVREGAVDAVQQDRKLNDLLRTWGWIVPLAALRRALIRLLLGRLSYRRQVSGTFQVSVIPTADLFAPFLFNTAGVLGAGGVQDRVVAVEGRLEIRPTLMLACCIDHKVWTGMDAANFLNRVKQHLERVASRVADHALDSQNPPPELSMGMSFGG